jgi:UDP-N-acetylglucosamine diphosphorylase/glucosamine-1-phosphate N-acetyltransferase
VPVLCVSLLLDGRVYALVGGVECDGPQQRIVLNESRRRQAGEVTLEEVLPNRRDRLVVERRRVHVALAGQRPSREVTDRDCTRCPGEYSQYPATVLVRVGSVPCMDRRVRCLAISMCHVDTLRPLQQTDTDVNALDQDMPATAWFQPNSPPDGGLARVRQSQSREGGADSSMRRPGQATGMQAVLLAAGEGTRMRPLTASTPKPMLAVADSPLVAHTADALVDAGVDELVVVVGYEAETVRAYFGSQYRGVPVAYAVQDEQLGTAHAVDCAREHLHGPFAVLNGDDLYDRASLATLLEVGRDGPAVCTYRVDHPGNYGVVRTEDGAVTDVVEKPADPETNLVNVGAYVFPAEAREWLDVPKSERGEHEITDVLTRVIEERRVEPVTVDRWLGCGRPWELLAANEWKLGELDRHIEGDVHESADLRGDVVVEAGATVDAGVVVEGPALLRAGAQVGPNAYVRGATLLGENTHVGNGVEIKNSVLMADSAVPHLSYVGDSVVGTGVNFGAGTKVANLRHDGADVRFTVNGERVSTGRRKFGVVAGPGAKTGINTSLDPGVCLSAGATTEPGEAVTRDR